MNMPLSNIGRPDSGWHWGWSSLSVVLSVFLFFVPARLDAADFCIVPVENGTPTEADHGDVHRLVSDVEVIPGLSSVYIAPLNRGGRWTIDESGAYVPFEGVFPTRKFLAHKNWVQRADGTVIGANRTDIFVLDPRGRAFRHLLVAGDAGLKSFGKLTYDAHTDTVLIDTYGADGQHLHALDGDRLVLPPVSLEAVHRGVAPIHPPQYIGMIDAYLITTERGYVYLRSADGTWRFVHEQWNSGYQARMLRVLELPKHRLIVVQAAQELFVIDVADPANPDMMLAILNRGNLPERAVYWSTETNSPLIYNDDLYFGRVRAVGSHWQWYFRALFNIIFGRMTASEPTEAGGSWLLKLTRDGMVPVPGDVIRPREWGYRSTFYETFLTDLPGRGAVLVFAVDGLALFDGDRVELIPESGPDHIGSRPRAVLLPTLDRVLITSELGMFELTRERHLRPLGTPFEQRTELRPGIDRSPSIFDAPELGGAVFLSADGVFLLNADEEFLRISGGEAVGFGAGVEVVATLPSGDLLIKGDEALFLLKQGHCGE